VQELLQRYRQTGSVEPRPHGGGKPGKVRQHLALIEQLHGQQPDASLAERCEHLAVTGQVRVSRMTMSRALDRLQLTRQKRRFAPPSKTHSPGSRREEPISKHSRG
jgi:transposase